MESVNKYCKNREVIGGDHNSFKLAMDLLHIAAAEGDDEKLKELLESTSEHTENESESDKEYEPVPKWNSFINKRDNRGLSPLQIAVLEGHFQAAKVLVSEGANIYRCSGRKRTLRPLHFCVLALANSSKCDSAPFLDLFLQAKANLFDLDRQKRTVFHIAALHGALSCLSFLAEYTKSKELEEAQLNDDASNPSTTTLFSAALSQTGFTLNVL